MGGPRELTVRMPGAESRLGRKAGPFLSIIGATFKFFRPRERLADALRMPATTGGWPMAELVPARLWAVREFRPETGVFPRGLSRLEILQRRSIPVKWRGGFKPMGMV